MPSPDIYQAWELSTLALARQDNEWNQVAQICVAVVSPWSRQPVSLSDFNPIARAREEKEEQDMASMAAELSKEGGPLSNEEIERRWKLLNERLDDGR